MGKKRVWGWTIVGIVVLMVIYLATRLTNLTALPIFTDEAIYIRWSQIGFRDANWRFISLTDGKQPMFTWIMMVLFKALNGADPLFIGRFTSVIAGIGTMLGLWWVAYELFKDKKIAWLASILYVFIPFTLWYDRMALYDSLVSTFSVWSLYLGIILTKHVRLDTALLLGMVLAGGMLNKSSGFLSLYFLPVMLLVFDWKNPKRLFRWLVLVLVAAICSQIFYSVLRLSPYFHIVGQKNNVFVFSLSEWLNQPFRFLAGNLRGMFDWLRHYLTLPLFIAVAIPFFARWGRYKERLLLYLWWLLPFVALATFAKILYPRFILFMTMPLLIVAAYGILTVFRNVKNPLFRVCLILILGMPAFSESWMIVTNPMKAPIPIADRGQFMDDWPAGGGVKEVVAYLRTEVAQQKISVYTEGTFGLMPYALEIYLVDNPNIDITGIWPLPPVMPKQMMSDAQKMPTYLVLNESQVAPNGWPLTLIGEYEKGINIQQKKLHFYRIRMPLATKL